MPTVVITPAFARVIQHLKGPANRLIKINTRHSEAYAKWHLWAPGVISANEETRVALEIVQDLRRLKLVEQASDPRRWPIKLVYQLSDVGKAFKLPAEKFWMKETTE